MIEPNALRGHLGSCLGLVGFVVLLCVFAVCLVRVGRCLHCDRVVLARLGHGVDQDVLAKRPLRAPRV